MERQEIERVHRVSDMLCSAHANLRDRYRLHALLLDLSIFALATWLVAMVFVEPQINYTLTPFNLHPDLWLGLLALLTFFLSIVQVLVNWKAKADAHGRSFSMYAEVKRECGYLLASGKIHENKSDLQRLQARYDMAVDVGVPVPEREFLKQKRKHLLKVELSRHLSKHPSASLLLTRLKLWWRDNVGPDRG